MVGILLITHAPVGAALLAAARHVFGAEMDDCVYLDVAADEALTQVHQRAAGLIARLASPDGVLVFSDLYGASPCNCAATLSVPGQVEVIAGVSLPLLIRALNYRARHHHLSLPALATYLVASAAQSVIHVVADDHRTASS